MALKRGTPKQGKLNFYFLKKPLPASPEPANVNNAVEERERPAPDAVVANETELREEE